MEDVCHKKMQREDMRKGRQGRDRRFAERALISPPAVLPHCHCSATLPGRVGRKHVAAFS